MIVDKKKSHYDQNKENISDKRKGHYDQNKENILGKKRGHYDKNRETILQKVQEKRENMSLSFLFLEEKLFGGPFIPVYPATEHVLEMG